MTREQLEHIIRAASTVANDDEIEIIGSQSILGQFPETPDELCISNEADVYPKNLPERWDVVDGTIGELSPFTRRSATTRDPIDAHVVLLARERGCQCSHRTPVIYSRSIRH